MSNRLAGSTSPYLAQHADNPVHWWPWSAEAFAEALARDVPVLLSVGYAACHWCHVMAHESFENVVTAEQMNDNYVCIKVDREERPDIDAVYMAATQSLTGHGGWPMTVFLTPQGRPFYAGTYFPPTPRGGLPSFPQLLTAISSAWVDKRDSVLQAAESISADLERVNQGLPAGDITEGLLAESAALLLRQLDSRKGGFAGAPKFPPAMTVEFLLRQYERTGAAELLAAADLTLDSMARGGIYDQLAGGFARYSVDAEWVVPHFEKMLYDNALLLRVYAHHYRLTGSAGSARVCAETVEFLLADLRTESGAFASALDADTDGVEGLTAVWTPAQLTAVLGESDGRWAAELFDVTTDGTFEEGASVLQLLVDPEDEARWRAVRRSLAAARAQRPQPARDDKVILSWNGLVIAALSEAGTAFGRPDWISAAQDAYQFLVAVHRIDGRWRRSSRDAVCADADAVLSDHSDLADGLCALFQATGNGEYLSRAGELLDLILAHFRDDNGGFFDTANDAETLVVRPRDPTDGATPAGASAAADALLTYSALTGDGAYREAAESAIAGASLLMARQPRAAGRWLATTRAMLNGPTQVAIVGDPGPARDQLLAAARAFAAAGTVLDFGVEGSDRALLVDRPAVNQAPAAYVCHDFVCDRPVTAVSDLQTLLTAG